MNIKKTIRFCLAAAAGLLAVGTLRADTTYIFHRTSESGAWNNPALWRLEDGSTPVNFPDSTNAIVVFREDNAIGLAGLFPNNNHQYVSLKEMRLEGCGGKWGKVSYTSDNLVSCELTYMGVLKFAAGGGLSFPNLPAVSPQPLYYYLSTVPGCQGDGEVVFDIPGNVEVNFDRSDILNYASGTDKPVLVKRGAGLLSIANGGNRWNTTTAGAGRPEVPIKIEAGTARLVFAATSHDIAVPLTFAGDTAKVIIDKRDNTRGGLGFGTGYIDETTAVSGGKHSIESQCGSILGFYGAPAVATQTFSGCLVGNVAFEFQPTTVGSEFVFRKGVSTTTGAWIIKNGRVRVTDGASFPNVTSVTINGNDTNNRGVVVIDEDGAAAFPKAAFTLYYGKIEVPAGRRVALRSVKSGWGTVFSPGVYKRNGSTIAEGTEAAWVAGDGLVVVGSPDEAAAEAVTWTGAANDGGCASTASNWSTPPQSLTDGSASITTDIGNYAHFLADSDVWVKGFSFAKQHFEIGAAEGKELRIGSGGFTNPGNGEIYVGLGSAPGDIVLAADQTWDPGQGHIIINGPVKTLGTAKLTVSGKGTTQLRLNAATPDWNNAVLVDNMIAKFNASNAFGSFKGNPVTILHYGHVNSPTFANGVEVNRPLILADRTVASGGTTMIRISANSAVTFNASLVSSNATTLAIHAGAGSRVVFNDLFMSRGNGRVSGSGTIVFNGPYHCRDRFYSATVDDSFTGTIELHSTGNRFNGWLGTWTDGTIKTMVPYAFTAQNTRRVTSSSDATNNPIDGDQRTCLRMGGTATLDLCGNDQSFGNMRTTDGGTITSETPATLFMDFTEEWHSADGTYMLRADKATYTGAVNYSKWGQLPRWFMAASTSTGIVEVAEGMITFCSGTVNPLNLNPSGTALDYDAPARGSWRNASAVVIKGGKMVFEHSESVGRHTDVRFEKMNNAYGKLRLESGVRQQVGYLYVDGVKQQTGSYGSTSSSAAHQDDTLFEGEGVIEVTGDSPFIMIFK
ncbi:MAG: hypothetical protein IKO40_00520 [Kiritimatiellae bacterium]|nr:hypothetical protein [Kiritimatiellia bacterium]